MFLLVPFLSGCAAAMMLGGLPVAVAEAKKARDAANAAADASEVKTKWGLEVLATYKSLATPQGREANREALGRAMLTIQAIGLIAREGFIEVEIWPLVGRTLSVSQEELMVLKNETDRQDDAAYMAALLAVLEIKQEDRAQQAA
jgi:hypothetical protein